MFSSTGLRILFLFLTGGIAFDAGQSVSTAFRLNLGGFANNTGGGSFSFSLANGKKDLMLNFSPAPVPEPGTWSMVGLGFMLCFARGWTFSRR